MIGGKNRRILKAVLSALVLIGAGCYSYIKYHTLTGLALPVKGATSLAFVLLGVVCFDRSSEGRSFSACMLAALIASFIGDILLVYSGRIAFIAGMAAFAAAHAFYALAFAKKSRPTKRTVILFFVFVAAMLALLLFGRSFDLGGMLSAVIVYALVLSFMLSSALTLPKQRLPGKRQRLMISLGAGLFFLSDLFLLFVVFSQSEPKLFTVINSLTYFPAQILLALSMQGGQTHMEKN